MVVGQAMRQRRTGPTTASHPPLAERHLRKQVIRIGFEPMTFPPKADKPRPAGRGMRNINKSLGEENLMVVGQANNNGNS